MPLGKKYVVHCNKAPYDVYIGRPSPFGNPYSHLEKSAAKFKVATREQAVSLYEKWLLARPELVERVKKELRGKTLGCYCAPLACHGDVLARIANEGVEPQPRSRSVYGGKASATPQSATPASTIPFTQFLRPDGRKIPVVFERDGKIAAVAAELIKVGCTFEVEALKTGEVSLECIGPDADSLATELCANGPDVPEVVDRLVMAAREAYGRRWR